MTTSRARGQGTVELALGAMLIVTVLLFGIHFGEVLFLSLKVQEAGTSAQWDATAGRVHELPGDFGMAPSSVRRTSREAAERYADFDGRSGTNHGSTFTQVVTAASGMRIDCKVDPPDPPFPAKLPDRLKGVYEDSGSVSCKADAEIRTIRIPQQFLAEADHGFFKEKHLHRSDYHACSFGKAFAPTCASPPGVMLDDWGLTGASETGECTLLEGCDNTAYKESVRKVYEAGGAGKGTAAINLAIATVGNSPIDPNHFWFSFRGEESAFVECVPFGDGPNQWETTPGLNSPTVEYDIAYRMRGECALGAPCAP